MLVSEKLTALKAEPDYVANSMILKSSNSEGCTYKWLSLNPSGTFAVRREIFISTSTTEETVESRTIISSIEISPAE